MNKESLLKKYPIGTKIKLINMDDIQSPPKNTIGIIVGIDDLGQLLVKWENGSSLNIIPNIDIFEIIK